MFYVMDILSLLDQIAAEQTDFRRKAVIKLIRDKQREYLSKCRQYSALYYTTRLTAAVCAVLLPFMVTAYPEIAAGLALAVASATAIDIVFNPKDRLALYSRATDILTISLFKSLGVYEQHKELLDTLVDTEAQAVGRLSALQEVFTEIRKIDAGAGRV